MYRVAFGLSLWVILGLIVALTILIYPLSLSMCPEQCTVVQQGDHCYLALPEYPFYIGKTVNCAEVGSMMDCYVYSQISNPTDISILLTTSRWEAQFMTAGRNTLYAWGCALAIAFIVAYTLVGFILGLVSYFDFKRSQYQVLPMLGRELI